MSYTPPDSKLVVLSFTTPYSPPDSRMVRIDLIPPPTGSTQNIYPNAIGDYATGGASVQNKAVALYPASINDTTFGTPAVANLSQEVTTAGATHTEFGTPEKVWNFRTFVREVSVGETDNDEQKPTVRNQHEYLRLSGAGHSLYGQPEMGKEDRGIHALAPLHAVGNLAAETYSPTCVAGGYGFFSGYSLLYDDSNGSTIKEYFWARVDYPSLTNPVKVPYTGSGRIDPYGRAVVATDGSYLYTFHVDVSNGGTSIPTLSKRDFDYNVISQVTLSTSRALGSVFVIDGRLYLHTDMSALLIEEIDKNTLAPISACPVSFSESSTSDGAYIYLNYSNRRVAIFDPTSNSIIGTTPAIVTPEQNGIITTHRNIVYAIGVQDKIWACMYERDEDPNATITGWRSFLLVYDRTTLTLEQTQDLRALTYSPSVATTLRRAGNYVIATPNGPRGDAWYYVFEASTAKPRGGFPGMNVPEEAFNNPVYEGVVPAVDAATIPTRLGRAARGTFSIGPFGYGSHTQYEWLFPSAAVFPNETLLLSVIKACDTVYDMGQLLSVHQSTPAATIAMRVHVENILVETLSPSSIAPPAMDSRPSIRVQWQIVTPFSTGHSVVNEVDFQLKNRQVSPFGIDPGFFGTPSLRNNLISPVGFGGAVVSMPDVTDKHQNLYPSSVVTIGMMGDIPTIWNYTQKVAPVGTDYAYFQNYQPTVENRNKVVDLSSLPIGKVGAPIVYNVALSFTPTSRDTSLFGQTELTNWVQYREPAGFNAALYGTLQIVNAAMVARPVPKDMSLFGALEISLRTRVIELPSIDEPYQDSEPWVSPYVRSFGPLGKIAATLYGSPGVTHDLRYVAPPTFYPAVFGSTRVDLFRRTLTFTGIFFDTPAAALGTPRLSPRVQAIDTQPIDSASFGALHIARKELFAEVTGDDAQAFGAPEVDLYRRYVQMLTTDMAQYGEPEVWNWRTYVAPWSQDDAHGGYGTLFIELRNRVLAMRGTDLSKFSIYTDVSNKARLLPATGTDVSEFGSAMVADKVRRLYPDGEELERFGTWFTVHNVRQIVDTSGIPRPYAGVPRVWRNEQITDALGGISSAAFGLPMVAPRIRTVVQYRADDPVAGFPTVELLKRYIIPPGFTGNFGWTTVEGHRNEARIYGADYLRFGEPLIANFNPQAWPSGMDYEIQTSRPWVSFRVRTIDLDGGSIGTPDPSRPEVAFRTRTVRPSGMVLSIIPNTHDIRWDMPQLPAQRTLLPDGVGPVVVPDNPPKPIVGALILWPESGEQSSFGMVEVRANSVWPSSTYSAFSDVSAVAVTHKNRTIYINTKNTPAVFEPGRVRLFPAVIGPFGDDDPRNLIDAYLASSENPFTRPFWGNVTVTNQHRQVAILGSSMLGCGLPELRTNHVQPDGWDSNEGKFGMTDFAGPQYIEPFWGRTTPDYIPEVPQYNFDTAKYGEVNVHYPVVPPVWSPYINAAGGYMTQFGYVSVESTIRNIYPEGFSPPQVPSVWLHPPFHLYPEGFEPPVPAILLIAPRIRSVYPVGDDMALVCEEDVSEIASRMRVRHGTGRYAVDSVAPATITFGEISHRNRSLPVDTLPAEALPAVRVQAQNIVAPAGTDAALVGTIRRAVFGELYPYAPDMQGFGYPRMNRRALMAGITPEAVSPARIARPIRPAGSSAFASDTALAITNIYGCRDRAIIVNGETDFSSFGGANVTH